MTGVAKFLFPVLACGLLVACSSSGTKSAAPTGTTDSGGSTLASQCSDIRTQFPDIPKKWAVAVSPFNGNLETVDPTNPSSIIGVEPDLITAISSCLGTTFSYASQPFASVINSLTAGSAQVGITGLFITPARVKVIDMVGHMSSVDQLYIATKNADKIKTPMDMCGHTIGSTVGTAEATYIETTSKQCVEAGKPAINQPHFQDIATLIANVVNGRLDATINSTAIAPQLMKEYAGRLSEGFHVPGTEYTIGIGVSKTTEGSKLPQAIEAAVAKVQDNGDYAKILEHWGFPKSAQVAAKLSTS